MSSFAIAAPSGPDQKKIDSTTTLLGNSAVYTSNIYHIVGWSRITGTCDSDQTGTLNIDQSPDGTNFDYTTQVAVTGGTVVGFSFEVITPWVRIRFTNTGGSTQTTFRLSTFVRTS